MRHGEGGPPQREDLAVSTSPHQEWGAAGGRTTASRLTAKQRKEASSHAHLCSIVAQIVKRAPELSSEQAAKVRAVFATVVSQEATRE
jgi:hypothetical protein